MTAPPGPGDTASLVSTGPTARIAYRPDLDGLRGIAVAAVVAFHAFPQVAPGGFSGVDIFLVISGYLITGILREHLDAGRHAYFAEFFARRARRIFPALAVVLITTCVAGWWLLLPAEYARLGAHAAAGAGFGANFLLWSESGYFDVEAQTKPLLHLWSLAIEEQFYLVWPLALYLARTRKSLFIALAVAALLASFWFSTLAVLADPAAGYYSPASRAWELLAGALLALCTRSTRSPGAALPNDAARAWTMRLVGRFVTYSRRHVFTPVALGLIAVSIWTIDKATPFPGVAALAGVTGALLIVASDPTGQVNRRILAHRFAVGMGLISYPLYLWHWPLLTMLHLRNPQGSSAGERSLAIVASLFLAWLTYRFLERPIRFGARRRGATRFAIALLLAAGLAGTTLWLADGLPHRFAQSRLFDKPRFDILKEWRETRCLATHTHPDFAPECSALAGTPRIALWGDSHAAALYPGLAALALRTGAGVAQFTAPSCPPFITGNKLFCDRTFDQVLAFIERQKPDVVILNARWAAYPAWPPAIRETIARLTAMGVARIVVIGPAPQWIAPLQNILARQWRLGAWDGARAPVRLREGLVAGIDKFDADMERAIEGSGAEYISAYRAMCNGKGCLIRVGDFADDLTAYDEGHFSPRGSRYLIEAIAGRIVNAP